MLDGDDTLAGDATLGAPSKRAPVRPGALFGRFLIVSEVGAGAFGQVFAAFDPQLDRKIALKVLRGPDEAQADGLVAEARAQAQFTHPNVVTVYDAGTEDGRAFIAMELVDGQDLATWLDGHADADWQTKLEPLLQAGDGLAAAHADATTHRDFKPGNVLLGADGRARVGDFGLAISQRRSTEDALEPAAAVPSRMVGTPYYMAPELFDGGSADAASDQYAFAVTAFEALYEVQLFERGTFGRLVATKAAAATLPTESRGVPTALGVALLQGMHPDPKQRWPDMQALLDALRTAATPIHRPWRSILVGIVVFSALVGGVLFAATSLQRASLERTCDAFSDALADAWTPDARQGVADGLSNTHARYAPATRDIVVPLLDDYATSLTTQARATCRAATIEQTMPAVLWPRAQRCFEDAARNLRSTTALLSRANEAILRSAQLQASALPPTRACGDLAYLSRRSQNDFADDPSALGTIADAQAALRSGAAEGVLEPLQALHERAPRSAPLLATLAQVEQSANRSDDARLHAKQAYQAARATNDTPLAADAAATLATIEASSEDRLDIALLWAELAQGELDALDEPALSLRRAHVFESRSRAAKRAGDYALAAEAAQQQLEIYEALLGPRDPRLPLSSIRVATAQLQAGETATASARLDAASKDLQEVLGDDHPDVATALDAQARLYSRGGESQKAYELDQTALKIRLAAYGPDHSMTAQSSYYVGVDLMKLDRNEEAIEHLRRGLETQERLTPPTPTRVLTYRGGFALALGAAGHYEETLAELERVLAAREEMHPPMHPKIGVVQSQLAFYAVEAGDPERALEHGRVSLQILEAVHGAEHPYLAYALEPLSRGYYALKRWADARACAQRALAVRQDPTVSEGLRADSGFILAKILWDAPDASADEQARALQLAADAVRSVDDDEVREDARRWLAVRTPSSD
ncbi:MAG: serine/threonine-protein kinase [Myxococcota bacterium]